MSFTIRPFEPRDQQATRRLIIDSLGEHFGVVNETINTDLEDIASQYASNLFFVAEASGEVVGSGALVYEGDGIARVMRMSVRRSHRRRGIASAVLERLLAEARAEGYWRVVLETGRWEDSVGLYRGHGFRVTSEDPWGYNMALDL